MTYVHSLCLPARRRPLQLLGKRGIEDLASFRDQPQMSKDPSSSRWDLPKCCGRFLAKNTQDNLNGKNQKQWLGRKTYVVHFGDNELQSRYRRMPPSRENSGRIYSNLKRSFNIEIRSPIGQIFLSRCQCMFGSMFFPLTGFRVQQTLHLPQELTGPACQNSKATEF